jgi:hypothetical protein
MKHGTKTKRGIQYKLRMMGIALSGPSFLYGDNMSIIHKTFKNKSNSICYHTVQELVAMDKSCTGHVGTNNNPADICYKDH